MFFQRKLDQHFGQIEQVIVIADDIMIVGNQSNHRDHDVALSNLLATARRSNIHLNYDKLAYKKTEVKFFGETYTTDGCKPAQSKVTVIVEMPPPTSKKQVQSFICMINYLSKFSARLSELAEPIRELCKDKVPFNWGPEHQAAFKEMKREIVRASILAYYNPKKGNSFTNRCEHKRAWSMLATRPETSILREQGPDRNPEGICGY